MSCTVTHEISITDVTGWISTNNLDYSLVILGGWPPFNKYLHQVIQYDCWKDDYAGEDSAALRV
jgi:hypothetical protein